MPIRNLKETLSYSRSCNSFCVQGSPVLGEKTLCLHPLSSRDSNLPGSHRCRFHKLIHRHSLSLRYSLPLHSHRESPGDNLSTEKNPRRSDLYFACVRMESGATFPPRLVW